MKNDIFVKTYLNIIKEDVYDDNLPYFKFEHLNDKQCKIIQDIEKKYPELRNFGLHHKHGTYDCDTYSLLYYIPRNNAIAIPITGIIEKFNLPIPKEKEYIDTLNYGEYQSEYGTPLSLNDELYKFDIYGFTIYYINDKVRGFTSYYIADNQLEQFIEYVLNK